MEKFLKKTTIYQGKILTLDRDLVLCDNGNEAYREVVRHSGGAAVLCFTEEQKVILVKQYRYAYQEELYEIPAGKLEPGEDPFFAAKRELAEEAGVEALNLTPLTTIYPTCGYSNEKIYLFLATKTQKTMQHLDEDEQIELAYFDLNQILEMIKIGKIKDAKTICAVFAYLLNQK